MDGSDVAGLGRAGGDMSPTTSPSPLRLTPRLQHYAWGDERFLPELMGMASAGPVAEAWYGAHPKAPATALVGKGHIPLDALIAEAGSLILGESVSERFGRLPYLLKILAIKRPLSVQVHPDELQASRGFAREEAAGISRDGPERFYRDPFHKPELLVALKPTFVLCGFRPLEEALTAIGRNPELRPLFKTDDLGSLAALLKGYYSQPEARLEQQLRLLLDRLDGPYQAGRLKRADPEYWVVHAHHMLGFDRPDRGLIFPLLLRLLRLQAGQAIFLSAGIPHAYLEGAGVELMSSSDNVLRAGLTQKPIDVHELLRIVRFDAPAPEIVEGRIDSAEGGLAYHAPVAEFRLSVRELDADTPLRRRAQGPETILVARGPYEGLELHWEENTLRLQSGVASLVPHGMSYRVHANGPAQVFIASVPV